MSKGYFDLINEMMDKIKSDMKKNVKVQELNVKKIDFDSSIKNSVLYFAQNESILKK